MQLTPQLRSSLIVDLVRFMTTKLNAQYLKVNNCSIVDPFIYAIDQGFLQDSLSLAAITDYAKSVIRKHLNAIIRVETENYQCELSEWDRNHGMKQEPAAKFAARMTYIESIRNDLIEDVGIVYSDYKDRLEELEREQQRQQQLTTSADFKQLEQKLDAALVRISQLENQMKLSSSQLQAEGRKDGKVETNDDLAPSEGMRLFSGLK